MTHLFSSTDALIDSVYPVVVIEVANPASQPAPVGGLVDQQQPVEPALEINIANVYRLRFQDRLSTGRGEPDDAAVVLEKVSHLHSVTVLFTWPIEYIRRYGCETKNIFILELGRRCAGYPNKVLRFDTRPAIASSLETDFAALVKKVLKFMDPAAKALSKNKFSSTSAAVTSLFTKKIKSPIVSNVACEYAELAPYQPKLSPTTEQKPVDATPSTHYARVIVNQ